MSLKIAWNCRPLFLGPLRSHLVWNYGTILNDVSYTKCVSGSRFFSAELEDASKEKKTKKAPEIRINLFTKNKAMTVTTLEDALKLAKRRGMTVEKVAHPPKYMTVGEREAYELILAKDIGSSPENLAKEAGFKGLKQMQINAKIAEHDLLTKVKKVNKWLESGFLTELLVLSQGKDIDFGLIISDVESKLLHCKLPGTVKQKSKTSCRVVYEPDTSSAKEKTS